jgi:hypothetical protein
MIRLLCINSTLLLAFAFQSAAQAEQSKTLLMKPRLMH